jgi:hypothetical protein
VHLVGRDAVQAVDEYPNADEPLAEADRAVLEEGADADGELFLAALAALDFARGDEAVI